MSADLQNKTRARVGYVQQKSRLLECQSAAPVRLLHPYFSDEAVCLMLSSYGGGMVQGDQVEIDLHIEPHARLFLGTQANSRVYKNDRELPTSQILNVTVGTAAKVVFLPDPLVLHSGSRFHQQQNWQAAPGAGLLIGEWFQCGRSDSGECFAYREYDSLIEISGEDGLWIREPFSSKPAKENPRQTGRFGDANLMLTLFAAGDAQEILIQALESLTRGQREYTQVPVLSERALRPSPTGLRSLIHLEDRPVSIYRALGRTRADFDPVWQNLQAALATPEWLGTGARLPHCRQFIG